MEILLIFLVIILFCSQAVSFTALYFLTKQRTSPQPDTTVVLTEDQLKAFKEADKEQVDAINNVLSNLNSFMTGEEIADVEEQ